MASYYVDSVTNTTATIVITGLDTSKPYKMGIKYWEEYPASGNFDYDDLYGESGGIYCPDGELTLTFYGLSAGTQYDFRVTVDSSATFNGTFTSEVWGLDGDFTTSGGGGGGGTPTFYVTSTDTSAVVHINDSGNYFYAIWLMDSGGGTLYDSENYGDRYQGSSISVPYTLSPNTSYQLRVDYSSSSSGSLSVLYTTDGDDIALFTTSGSSGHSWNIDDNFPTRYVDNGHQIQFYAGDIGYYYLLCIPMYFNTAGTYTVETSSSESLYAYLSTSSYWNDSSGEPDSYYVVGSDTSSSNGFSFSATVNDSSLYYLYLRTMSGNSNSYNFLVEFYTSGGGGGGTWQLIGEDKGTLSSSQTYTLSGGLVANRLYSYAFMFSTACSVTFSSSSSADLFGWLSNYNQTTWGNNSNGYPDQYVPDDFFAYNDDIDHGNGNDNFSITYSCEANRVYYLWFRQFSGYEVQSSVTINVSVTIPTAWDVSPISGGNNLSQTLMLETVSVYEKTLTRISFTLRRAGSVRFYSTGQSNVQAYLSTSTSYDNSTGVPNSGTITLYGSTGTSTTNFDCTATLYAGTTYYLWVRGVSESTSGTICVVIVPPSGGSVSGNGQVYIYSNGSWLEATPYIYVNGSWIEATPGIYVNGSWI